MAETFHLSLLTPARGFLETDVVSFVAPGSAGYLGVLAHHAPLITALSPGKLEVTREGQEVSIFAVSGGFLEVSNNRATILADAIESADSIDVDRAERARDRARARLQEPRGVIDVARAEAALRRALNRLRVARSG